MQEPAAFDVKVHPARALRGEVRAQPSKNYTTRFLLAAALSDGETLVRFPATSEDSEAMQRCLREWGAALTSEALPEGGSVLRVRGFGASPLAGRTLDPGNAGAVVRFLIGVAVLTRNTTFITSFAESLGRRPQGDLLDALRDLGADVRDNEGKLPVTVSGPVLGGPVRVSAERSSQYASALLFLGPLLEGGLDLTLTGDVKSEAPLRQTLHTLEVFGVQFEVAADLRRVVIPGGQAYRAPGGSVTVPGDYPGSAAVLAAAAVVPGEVRVVGLLPGDLQGEREALEVLREMGADVQREGPEQDVVVVRGGAPLRGVRRDGDRFTDAVQALTAAAVYADGTTVWENVYTLRLKECDRISDTRRELLRLGVRATETADSLTVTGADRVAGGVTVSGHGDHRMIMLLTVVALRAQAPVTITGAQHIRKSYPEFFTHLSGLGARFEFLTPEAART